MDVNISVDHTEYAHIKRTYVNVNDTSKQNKRYWVYNSRKKY